MGKRQRGRVRGAEGKTLLACSLLPAPLLLPLLSTPHSPLPTRLEFFILNVYFRGDFVKNAHIKVKIEDRLVVLDS
jgi:hypothetical protein